MFRHCSTIVAAVVALTGAVSAQQVSPSNNTNDIPPVESSPRFWVNGTTFPNFRVIPLGWYAQITQQNFLNVDVEGRLLYVDASNANAFTSNAIDYISCDPEDYTGVLGANDVLRIVLSAQQGNSVILYSTRADHCEATNLRSIALANGIFSTLDPATAASVASQVKNMSNGLPAVIKPDPQSYGVVNNNGSSAGGGYSSNSASQPGPTTALAMIILYSITGIITALFVIIIVTGAVRAHRHPERYGPSNIAGRPRRSRAKGIARAMLDTIPIVKFGEKEDAAPKDVDIEMSRAVTTDPPAATAAGRESDAVAQAPQAINATNPDGTDEQGHLGCSICTEDFNKGEEVRVLPCNHKFHPECVDPWLLNVSGTCPLCRIDLRPPEEQAHSAPDGEPSASRLASTSGASTDRGYSVLEIDVAPPLGHMPIRLDRARRSSNAASSRRDTVAFANLRSVASGSREDRIAALRRFRQQGRSHASTAEHAEQEDERRGLSARLRERFRVRTRRQGEDEEPAEASTAGGGPPRPSSVGAPSATGTT